MKFINKIIKTLLLVVVGFNISYSQEIKHVLIQSNSADAVPNVSSGITGPYAYCSDTDLNTILMNYDCTTYIQDFPQAKSEAGRRLYRIEIANSSNYSSLITTLLSISHLNEIFPVMKYYEVADCDCEDGEQLNDPMLPNHMIDKINIECAWEITHGNSDIQVAAVDVYPAGSDIANDDLVGKLTLIPTIRPNFNNPQPGSCNHGLGIAGAIAAIPNNEWCTAGLGYNTTVAGYNAGTWCGGGLDVGLITRQAYLDGHRIINLAWSRTPISVTVAREMTDNGVTIVHADRKNGWSDVGSIPGVIGVGKVDWNDDYEVYDVEDGNPICDTNMDILMSTNNIARPTSDNMCEIAGSKNSIGSALVSGVIALMMDVNPCLNPAAFEDILESTHQGIPTNQEAIDCGITAGIIDAYAAVCLAEDYCADPIELNDVICTTRDCQNMLLSGDVIVEAGQTLTVTGTLTFAECASLIVKREGRLIIDGGTLTSCGDEWMGVVVEGLQGERNNQTGIAGKVELINKAVIENARIGITTNARHLPWQDRKDFWGGYIMGDDATIRNCRRGVAFMKSEAFNADGLNLNIQDMSSFNKVTFESIRDSGVSIWGRPGIDFTWCTFVDVGYGPNDNEGIIAVEADVDVANSSFDGCERGITIEASRVFPSFNACLIETNDFSCEKESILLSNGFVFNTNGHQFKDNVFRYGTTGIFVDGPTSFTISNNSFFNQREEGIFMRNSGNSFNNVIDNTFESNIRAICYNGTNGTSQFLTNCFNASRISDVEVADIPPQNGNPIVAGRINPVQGDEEDEIEAGNVFTKAGEPEILTSNNPTFSIDYLVWEGHPANARQRVTNSSLNVVEVEVANENPADNCGSTIEFLPPDPCEIMVHNTGEIIALISTIDDYLATENVSHTESMLLGMKEHLLIGLLNSLDPDGIYSEEFRMNYLRQRPEFTARALVPSILMDKGDYNVARYELSQIPSSIDGMEDYKTVQSVNIDFLENGKDGVSSSELNDLHQIAHSYDQAGSYARALYHRITEERIILPKFYVTQDLDKRSRSGSLIQVSCFPNPSNIGGELNLSLDSEDIVEYAYTIYRTDGVEILEGILNSERTEVISTTTFSSGIYVIQVIDESGELIHVQTLSILD